MSASCFRVPMYILKSVKKTTVKLLTRLIVILPCCGQFSLDKFCSCKMMTILAVGEFKDMRS